jgi:hypothetical protein
MHEWLPAVLGCTWGWLVGPWAGRGARGRLALALGLLGVGLLAALVSGELAASPWFVAVDVAIAGVGAAVGAYARRALPRTVG